MYFCKIAGNTVRKILLLLIIFIVYHLCLFKWSTVYQRIWFLSAIYPTTVCTERLHLKLAGICKGQQSWNMNPFLCVQVTVANYILIQIETFECFKFPLEGLLLVPVRMKTALQEPEMPCNVCSTGHIRLCYLLAVYSQCWISAGSFLICSEYLKSQITIMLIVTTSKN